MEVVLAAQAYYREGCAAEALEQWEDAAQAYFQGCRIDPHNIALAQVMLYASGKALKQSLSAAVYASLIVAGTLLVAGRTSNANGRGYLMSWSSHRALPYVVAYCILTLLDQARVMSEHRMCRFD